MEGISYHRMMKKVLLWLLLLSVIGLIDSSILTYRHFSTFVPPCTNHILFADCGKVLSSTYSVVYGVPLAMIGVFYYGVIAIITIITVTKVIVGQSKKPLFSYLLIIIPTIGFLSSLYFIFLQVFVIKAICLYCMLSALTSTLLFITTQLYFRRERHILFLKLLALGYRCILKKIFFIFDPEFVHNRLTSSGERMGRNNLIKHVFASVLEVRDSSLEQVIHGVTYPTPIGLAAGFDYEGKLTQILPSLGFGFHTIGTITNHAYKGNPGPMLGRLPQSRSLMVNKGFKNLGAEKTAHKLSHLHFDIPVGISIGRTNTLDLKTQKESIKDIIKAFKIFEKSQIKHTYYELNISCPNLYGDITFYPPQNLKELLIEIDKLKLKKPVYIKMPIEKSNEEVLDMLEVISQHSPVGVIFGNLQKNRHDPAFVQNEVRKFHVGNFSGKPTYQRSNELIELAYRHYAQRFTIIGCGGVFNAHDAYKKITLGASLIQLITGMIFEGPQLIAQINLELMELLAEDGFTHIYEAVGSRNSPYGGFRKCFT